MPSVNRPKPQAKFHEGRPNALISITEVKTYMIKFTDGEGREEIAQVQVFGKNNEDGGTGVWIIANEEELQRTLRIANKHVRRNVRAAIKALSGDLSEDDLPEDGGAIDVGEVDSVTEDEEGASALDTMNL